MPGEPWPSAKPGLTPHHLLASIGSGALASSSPCRCPRPGGNRTSCVVLAQGAKVGPPHRAGCRSGRAGPARVPPWLGPEHQVGPTAHTRTRWRRPLSARPRRPSAHCVGSFSGGSGRRAPWCQTPTAPRQLSRGLRGPSGARWSHRLQVPAAPPWAPRPRVETLPAVRAAGSRAAFARGQAGRGGRPSGRGVGAGGGGSVASPAAAAKGSFQEVAILDPFSRSRPGGARPAAGSSPSRPRRSFQPGRPGTRSPWRPRTWNAAR